MFQFHSNLFQVSNMGKRGSVEEVTTRVASTLKSSELLTDAGVHHAIVVLHPTEGLIFCGEEKFTQTIQDLVEVNGVDKLMKKAVMNSGSRPKFRSSRKEKEELLQTLYDCNLPAMPYPFSELRTSSLPILQAQLARVLEVETTGLRLKHGDPLPDSLKEWFEFGEEAFYNIKGSTYSKALPGAF